MREREREREREATSILRVFLILIRTKSNVIIREKKKDNHSNCFDLRKLEMGKYHLLKMETDSQADRQTDISTERTIVFKIILMICLLKNKLNYFIQIALKHSIQSTATF